MESNVARTASSTRRRTGSFTGNLKLGPKGKAKGYTGPFTRLTAPLVPTLPDFAVYDPSSGTKRDSALWNDNQTAIAPFLGTTKVTYDATKRELTVAAGVTLTLPPGVYNFCKLTLEQGRPDRRRPAGGGRDGAQGRRADLPRRQGARRLALLQRRRPRRRRPARRSSTPRRTRGRCRSSPGARGRRSRCRTPSNFSGIIWAPRAKVKFNGKGKLTGGVSGDKIETHKEMKVK